MNPIRTYSCKHEARNTDTCEDCKPILQLIRSNNRLMNIRHVFLKLLTEMGSDHSKYDQTLSAEERSVILGPLIEEAR